MNFVLYIISYIFKTVVSFREILYKKNILQKKRFSVPIVSIGNIAVGGSGKTPMVVYLSNYFEKQKIKHVVVSRGYKKQGRGTLIVQDYKKKHILNPKIAGDEPILLSQKLSNIPIVVDSNKLRGVRSAITKFKPQLILIDDGFQSHYITKNHDLVLIDHSIPVNKYTVMPLGILREPINALKRASFVLFVNKGTINPKVKQLIVPILKKYKIPSLDAEFESQLYKYNKNQDKLFDTESVLIQKIKQPVIAISGIGNATSFVKLTNRYCLNIIKQYHFTDHFQYSIKNKKIKNILTQIDQSQKEGSPLGIITTLKDFVKIKQLKEFQLGSIDIYVIDINLQIQKSENLLRLINPKN